MTRKRNYMLRLLTSVAIVMLMSVGMILPALADDPPKYSSGIDADRPAYAAITKLFKMPINTPIPEAEFIFTFEAKGMQVNGVTNATTTGMPQIGPVKINFAAGEEPSKPGGKTETIGDTIILAKESEDFAGKIKGIGNWKNGAGIYVYEVEEDWDNSSIKISDEKKEKYVFSPAKYTIEIWVEEDGTTKELFVMHVSARIISGSRDEYYEGKAGIDKVDPTPGGWSTVPYDKIEDGFSQLIFTNKYWKTDGGGEENPDVTAFEVIKIATGNGADFSKRFEFNVKVIRPSVVSSATSLEYRAYVLDKSGNNVTSTDHYADIKLDGKGKNSIVFTSGVELEGIKLKHEERLVFVDLPVGSNVEVKEDPTNEYKPVYKRTFHGTGEHPGEKGNVWGFPLNPADNGAHYLENGPGFKKATFTNIRTGATPTGLDVDDLPYFVLIGFATAGLTGFVAVKSRKRSKSDV